MRRPPDPTGSNAWRTGLIARWIERLRAAALGAVAALLPRVERRRIEQRFGVSGTRWSLGIGIAELFGGLGLFMATGIDRIAGGADAISQELLRGSPQGLSNTHIGGGGVVSWLAWLLSPYAWFLLFVAIVGTLRIGHYLAHRESIAEPSVWLGVRINRVVERKFRRWRMERKLGPLRPDRVLQTSESRLRVVSCRPKPAWSVHRTIAIAGRFYGVAEVSTVKDGEGFAVAYDLLEHPPGTVIRGLTEYEWIPEASPRLS